MESYAKKAHQWGKGNYTKILDRDTAILINFKL